MKVGGAHEAMVTCWVMLGMVVAEIFGAGSPEDSKLSLLFAVFEPVEAHVHCFGALLFDRVVGEAYGCRVVCLYRRGRLRMTEFD